MCNSFLPSPRRLSSVLAASAVAGALAVSASGFAAQTKKPAAKPSVVKAAVSAAEQNLLQLRHQIRAAQAISFTAQISTPQAPGQPETVKGVFERPGRLHLTASTGDKVAMDYVSDGANYTLYAPATKHYVTGAAQKGLPDSNRTGFAGIVRSEIGMAPFSLAFAPIGLVMEGDITLPAPPSVPGLTVRSSVTEKPGTVDGQPVTVCTQLASLSNGSGAQAAREIEVSYTRSSWQLKQVVYRTGRTASSLTEEARITFSTFQLGSGTSQLASAADFAVAPPAGATVFTPPADTSAASGEQAALKSGAVAPDFTVQTADGKPVKLSDYAGKVVVLDLWATWCGPCQMSLPHTAKIAEQYQSKGVVFMPVCVADTRDAFKTWLPKHKALAMTFLFDPAGRSQSSFSSTLYKTDSIPTQFVIGKDGKIAASFVGYDAEGDPDEKALMKAIDVAIAANPAPTETAAPAPSPAASAAATATKPS